MFSKIVNVISTVAMVLLTILVIINAIPADKDILVCVCLIAFVELVFDTITCFTKGKKFTATVEFNKEDIDDIIAEMDSGK